MAEGPRENQGGRWALLSLVVTVAVLAWLLSQTDLRAILESFERFSPLAALLGFLAWALQNLLRAWRFRLLVSSRPVPMARMFSIVNVQNLLATLTPGRAGEISYVVLLRSEGQVPSVEGLAGLVVARAFDFVAGSGIVLACIWAARSRMPASGGGLLVSALAIFGLSLVAILTLAWLTAGGVRLLQGLIRWSRLDRFALARKLAGSAEDVHHHIVRMHRRGTVARLIGSTIAIWVVSYGVSLIWIFGLDLPVDFTAALFVSAVAGLAVSLPVQGVAGLGTTEAGWAIPLILLGVPREGAIAAGFCFHALALLYLAALAGGGMLHLYLDGRTRAKPVPGK